MTAGRQTGAGRRFAIAAGIALLAALSPCTAAADIAEDIGRCVAEAEPAARLACYDAAASRYGLGGQAGLAAQAAKALDQEFTFSSARLRAGPLRFQVPVKGIYSPANRAEAFPQREVENVAIKIRHALRDLDNWRLRATVHPVGVAIEVGRAMAYTGAELKTQAEQALARSGLEPGRTAVVVGEPLTDRLATVDQRREAQALVDVEILGLSGD